MGTDELSWWELREFIVHECRDETSALWRALNPDRDLWADPKTLLLGKIATATDNLRWMQLIQLYDKVPDELAGWDRIAVYGPSDTPAEDVPATSTREDIARQVAAELLAAS